MRARLGFLLASFLTACAAPPPSQAGLGAADSLGVLAAFDSMYAATARLDLPRTLAAYDTVVSFAHVFDDRLLRGRPALDRFITSAMASLRPFEGTRVDSTHFVPVSRDAILLVTAYREVIVDTAGNRTPGHGMWTNLFVRRPTGWKILYSHSTFVADQR